MSGHDRGMDQVSLPCVSISQFLPCHSPQSSPPHSHIQLRRRGPPRDGYNGHLCRLVLVRYLLTAVLTAGTICGIWTPPTQPRSAALPQPRVRVRDVHLFHQPYRVGCICSLNPRMFLCFGSLVAVLVCPPLLHIRTRPISTATITCRVLAGYSTDKNAQQLLGMPVDLYVGGIEHAVMHLLYARFLGYD